MSKVTKVIATAASKVMEVVEEAKASSPLAQQMFREHLRKVQDDPAKPASYRALAALIDVAISVDLKKSKKS